MADVGVSAGAGALTINEFIAKWRDPKLSERAGAQSHFIDLCHALGERAPSDRDQLGDSYTFEKSVTKTGGGSGFADVWYRGHFGWEYKRPGVDLTNAYIQLHNYSESLENPPLLVVCDFLRFEIHTNFTNTVKDIYRFTLDELDQPENQRVLRALFSAPDSLRPQKQRQLVTQEAAGKFSELAGRLHARGEEPTRVAHALVQILFCLFAEDVRLLRESPITRLFERGLTRADSANRDLPELFAQMASGGDFWGNDVPHFNGGMFATVDLPTFTADDFLTLSEAAKLDWSSVEPAIFGTLFERSLDPKQRAQLGAHYTGRADIMRVVDPVVVTPLRRKWETVRAKMEAKATEAAAAPTTATRRNRQGELSAIMRGFQEDLTAIRVLDPACGSGNFLYLALAALLDLEQEMLRLGATMGLSTGYPQVSPRQMLGLEINAYARELAQAVIWIGYLQWMHEHGYRGLSEPILDPLETIRLQDALLDRSDPEHPKEAVWPAADFIIGNPPFLGGQRLRSELGDDYANQIFSIYGGELSGGSDLACYFFERARESIEAGRSERAGLLATNSIRSGANREVLRRIKETGDIFMAWSDEPWVLAGAAVRISIVAFDDGREIEKSLNGVQVPAINSDLTGSEDITRARRLPENRDLSFIGVTPIGPFDVDARQAKEWLELPPNPNLLSNSDVVRPYVNARDVVQRSRNRWIVDFGMKSREEAAFFEAPFEHVATNVRPLRETNRRETRQLNWWRFGEPCPDFRAAVRGQSRYLVTPRVAKHRIFVWLSTDVLPGNKLVLFAREDDYFLGVLHSRAHELWSLKMGSWQGKGNDPVYQNSWCFETFPLPWPPGEEPVEDPRVQAIAAAAKELDARRQAWLNPPDASEAELKKRTLTNLYNQRPTWLAMLHDRLDRAVWSAYGWDDAGAAPADLPEETILARLLELNLARSAG